MNNRRITFPQPQPQPVQNQNNQLIPLPPPRSSQNNQLITSCHPRSSQIIWNDPQISLLINERRRRNFKYHYFIPGHSRQRFWDEIANTINVAFFTNYTGAQCMSKFNNLVSDYHVSINQRIARFLN